MAKNSNKKNKKDNKYNAENEIIIGVTTKPKEKVRVEKKKTTRTNTKSTQSKRRKENRESNKSKSTKSNQSKKNTNNTNNKSSKSISNKKQNNKNIKVRKNNSINFVEETKEEKIKKINIKKIMISIIVVLFIALCGTIYYLTTPVFNIAKIEVYGSEKNSVDTYISLSRIDIGVTNIFGITNNSIRKNIKENSYVEDVSLKRKLPNVLEIYITERKVAYQAEYSNTYIYIDNQGYILEVSEDKKDVPIIKGFSTIKGTIQIGQRLIEEDLIKLNTVAKIINYFKYNIIENKITNIDVTDDTNYILHLKEDKKIVYVGDASNLSERLSLLKTILKNEAKKSIEIFMNGDLNKDNVYIRYIKD